VLEDVNRRTRRSWQDAGCDALCEHSSRNLAGLLCLLATYTKSRKLWGGMCKYCENPIDTSYGRRRKEHDRAGEARVECRADRKAAVGDGQR
jgi:hypothetical protein